MKNSKIWCIMCFTLLFSINTFALRTVNSNETWTGTFTETDIFVTNGATLTISGTTTATINGVVTIDVGAHLVVTSSLVWMGTSGRIIVKSDYASNSPSAGGTLTITSSTVGPVVSFGPGWQGIEIWGMNDINTNKAQTYSAKATITNSTIRTAEVGIANYKDGTAGMFLNTIQPGSGGIIQATNSNFTSNKVSVWMSNQMYYVNGSLLNDQSYFRNCTFNGAASYTVPTSSYLAKNHVVLDRVQGVRFYYCNFYNATAEWDCGIYASGAGFWVNTCNFLNFRLHGIQGNAGPYLVTASVISSTFTDILSSNIYLTEYAKPYIASNSFSITGSSINASLGYVGISLERCPGMTVEDNDIEATSYSGWTPGPSDIPVIGIKIFSAGMKNNYVSNNSIKNMDYALQAIGQNRSDPASGLHNGLKFVCNSITSTNDVSYDIITGPQYYPLGTPLISATSNMAEVQSNFSGSSYTPANNIFDSKTTTTLPKHFDNALAGTGSHYIDYYYYTSGTNAAPTYNNLGFGHTHSLGSPYTCLPSSSFPPSLTTLPSFLTNLPVVSSGTEDELSTFCTYVDGAMAWYIYGDTTKVMIDSLESVLSNAPYLYEYQLMLAKVYVAQGRFQDAIDLINDISSNYTLNSDELEWTGHIKTIYEIAKDLHDNNDDWSSVNGGLKSSLSDIMSEDAFAAKSLGKYYMQTYEGTTYTEDYIWEDESEAKPSFVNTMPGSKNIAVYPNPLKDNLYIEASQLGLSKFEISDVLGRIFQQGELRTGKNVINIKGISPGLYQIKLVDGNGKTQIEKLVKE